MQTHTHTHIAEEVLHIHLNAQICVKHPYIHMHLYKFNGGYVKYAGNCLQIISIGIGIWQQRRNKFLLHTRKQQYRKSRYSLLRYIYIYTYISLYPRHGKFSLFCGCKHAFVLFVSAFILPNAYYMCYILPFQLTTVYFVRMCPCFLLSFSAK